MLISSRHVQNAAGVSARQLAYWHQIGLIKASAKNTGRRKYTVSDVVVIRTIAELRSKGCSLQKVRKAVHHLQLHFPQLDDAPRLASLTLLTDGKTVYLLNDAKQVMEVVSKQTVLWVVNIEQLIKDAQRQLAALPLEWDEIVTIKRETYTLRVSADRREGGFVVQCLELPGAIEQGETADEAITNGKNAIESVLAFVAKRSGAQSVGRARRHA